MRSSPRPSACPRIASSSAPRASTTNASSTSSATARPETICIRRFARSSTPTPRASAGGCGSRSTSGSATSPPSPASIRSEYVPWFLRHDDQVEHFRRRSTSTSAARTRTSRSSADLKRRLDAGEELEIEPTSRAREPVHPRDRDGRPARALRQRAQRRPDRRSARRMPASRSRCSSTPTASHPTPIGEIPPQCLALNRTFQNVVELTVRAVVDGLAITSTRPRCSTRTPPRRCRIGRILDLVDELIEAHGDLIPEAIRR